MAFAIGALLLALFGAGWLVGRLGIGSAVSPASLTDLERQFIERMRDVWPYREERLTADRTTEGSDPRIAPPTLLVPRCSQLCGDALRVPIHGWPTRTGSSSD